MIQKIKHFSVGFLISFLGTLPLGYLNFVGFEIFKKFGNYQLWSYFLGVVLVEVLVVYFTVVFAQKINAQKKLLRFIKLFSIAFLLFLAYTFYTMSIHKNAPNVLQQLPKLPTFIIGVFLSGINLQQWPYWTAWNLYLSSNNYIETYKKTVLYFVFGTAIGTLSGMYTFVMCAEFFLHKTSKSTQSLLTIILPLFFLVLALLQLYSFLKKKK